MPESLGARLRQHREAQHVDLIAIAAQTKIKLSLLEALERDDVSQWPAGIFRRAYIRAYAQAIHLDPDVVVREFVEAHPEPAAIEEAAIAAAAANNPKPSGPRARFRNIVGSAFGLSRPHVQAEANDRGAAPRTAAAGSPTSAPTPAPPLAEDVRPAAPPPEPPRAVEVRKPPAPSFQVNLEEVARLCTGLCRVAHSDELQPLLAEAAAILDARGLIVWVWDGASGHLRAALAHGYSEQLLAQVPAVARDADNATAAAFRTARTCAIAGSDDASGALAVPLLTPWGCAGVLAIELPHGREGSRTVRALAAIVAASLAQLTGGGEAQESDASPELAAQAT